MPRKKWETPALGIKSQDGGTGVHVMLGLRRLKIIGCHFFEKAKKLKKPTKTVGRNLATSQ